MLKHALFFNQSKNFLKTMELGKNAIAVLNGQYKKLLPFGWSRINTKSKWKWVIFYDFKNHMFSKKYSNLWGKSINKLCRQHLISNYLDIYSNL